MLGRFAKYLDRTWVFSQTLDEIRDDRSWCGISSSAVYLSCFGMFSLRLPSFNALEQQLLLPQRWDVWVGKRKPSADTLGYALERMDIESLRKHLVKMNHQVKRKKVLQSHCKPYVVAAVDGHELFSSRKRCCEGCLERSIETVQGIVIEYYHRVVVLQVVDAWPSLILDIEPILHGEGEVTAAQRMLERAKKLYPRFFDILTFDALYLQAPFTKRVIDWGWDVVIVLKQENRELYKDVDGLMKIVPPKTVKTSTGYIQYWDLQDLRTWTQLDRAIRVVCSKEKKSIRERVALTWSEKIVESEWRWASSLSTKLFDVSQVGHIGHARWDEENKGFMELAQYWNMDHCFHHHPVAILALLFILAEAFILCSIFYKRNLKMALQSKICRLTLSRLFADDLSKIHTTPFWIHPP